MQTFSLNLFSRKPNYLLIQLTLFIFSTTYTQAQKFAWSKAFTTSDGFGIEDLYVTSQNKLLLTGSFNNTMDFNPGTGTYNLTSNGFGDAYYGLYSNNANISWVKSLGDSLHDSGLEIAEDSEGNIIVAGYFRNTVDFDPGSGIQNMTSNGAEDVFIAKYDTAGNYIWSRSFGGTDWEYVFGMKVDKNDNIYVTGLLRQSIDLDAGSGVDMCSFGGGSDMYLVKYDKNGSYKWGFAVGAAGGEEGYDLGLDSLSNVYVSGTMRNTVDFDPGTGTANVTSVGLHDHFLAKYDSSGVYQWAFNVGHSGVHDENAVVAVEPSGNVYLAGRYRGLTDFAPGPGFAVLSSWGLYDMFIAKYTASGTFDWVFRVGGSGGVDGINDIVLDSDNNIYVTGNFGDTADFDPSADSLKLVAAGNHDMFFASYGPDASFRFAQSITTTGSIELAEDIILDNDGNIFVSGYFAGTVDFDPGTGTSTHTALGSTDYFLFKYDACANAVPGVLSSMTVCPGETYTIQNSGSLNDHEEWGWYTGSCGDSLISTNDSLVIVNAVSKTYYVQGQGSCFLPGSCDSIVVTAIDTTKPVPMIASLPDSIAECSVTIMPPEALDNCTGIITATTTDSTTYFTQGNRTITWTYDDGNGNTITQQQNVIVADTTQPVPLDSVLADSTDECEVMLVAPYALDNCGDTILAYTLDSTHFLTQGARTITWIYDDGNGNTTNQTQNVIIDDITLPLVNCPTDVTDDLDGTGPTKVVNNIDVVANDDCGINSITYELTGATTANGSGDASGLAFEVGLTTVTYVVEDNNQNIDSCSFTVDINNPFVGINESKEMQLLNVFPNPTNGELNIKFPFEAKDIEMTLISSSGQTIQRWSFSEKSSINLDLNVTAGIYSMTVLFGGEVENFQLVIE